MYPYLCKYKQMLFIYVDDLQYLIDSLSLRMYFIIIIQAALFLPTLCLEEASPGQFPYTVSLQVYSVAVPSTATLLPP